jgi:hypothetical protein
MGKYYDVYATYSAKELSAFLKEYSQLVRMGEYKSIPYGTWQKFSNELKYASSYTMYEVGGCDGEVCVSNPCSDFSVTLTEDLGLAQYLTRELWWGASAETGYYDVDGIYVSKTENSRKIEKENENMKGLNFDFGPCTNDGIKMSMYGIAIRNAAGNYVSYNKQTGDIIDVDLLNFDGGQFLFKMPVPVKDIKVGDVVIHNKKAMFVTTVDKGNVGVVDISAGEIKSIIPTKSMFGFDFVTKIVSIMDAVAGAPSPNEPFGNMLPFLMMQDGKMDKNMALALMMSQNGGNFATNPMLMYLMMSDGKNSNDMLPLMLMMGGNFGAQAPVVPQQMELEFK